MDTMLYVRNLSKTTTENELRNLFSQVGEVTSLRIIMDRVSGQSRQFGFLSMSAESEANRAVSRFNNYLLGEQRLMVGFARPKPRSSAPGALLEP